MPSDSEEKAKDVKNAHGKSVKKPPAPPRSGSAEKAKKVLNSLKTKDLAVSSEKSLLRRKKLLT
jgi:hypothetical protein